MTHLTPTSLLFFSVAIVASYTYLWWHLWYYDRFASIFPTRRQAFKCIITWWYLATHMLYGTFATALTYIKYSVGYMDVPGFGTVPTPYAKWPKHFQEITPTLYYVLAAALVIHVSTQIEETCYWIQLARSIRGKTSKSWLSSVWFIIWLVGTIGAGVIFYGVTIPVEDDPQHMETNLLFTASIWTIVATVASFYVVFKFPQLIQSVRGQGGSQEVLMRLSYHRRLTKYRIYGRLTFCIPLLVITIDGLTSAHEVAHREYLTDLFVVIGLFGLFCSSIVSILIYFPPMRFFSTTKGDDEIAPILPMSPVKPTPGGHHVVRMTEVEEARYREHEQVKSQLSIVAPFATPPPTPKPIRGADDEELFGESPRKMGAQRQIRGKVNTNVEEYAGTTISPLSSLSPPNGQRRDTRVPIQAKEDTGSQYAWSMLADHLRLPENAMGLMSMEMNEGNTKWREARRNVEQQFFPGVMTQTQRDMTIRFEEHQERLRSPRLSVDPYGGLDTSPEQHRQVIPSQPGQPPHLGPPLPIIQADDLTSSDILNSYLGQEGLPTGQSDRFTGRRADNRSPTPTTSERSRKPSYKRKPLPAVPGITSRHQPLGVGVGLSVEEEDERARSLPPPLRSPPKNSPMRRSEDGK